MFSILACDSWGKGKFCRYPKSGKEHKVYVSLPTVDPPVSTGTKQINNRRTQFEGNYWDSSEKVSCL
jgi:hypothetical protein